MSHAGAIAQNLVIPTEADQRFSIHGVIWQQYQAITATLATFPGIRLSYFLGTLEFMTVSKKHELIKSLISLLIYTYLQRTGQRFYATGAPTLKLGTEVELQPDDSFNFERQKEFPDLAIEVIISSGSTAKLQGYSFLGVKEVWIWQKDRLTLYGLTEASTYETLERSQFMPDLDMAQLRQCLAIEDQFEAIATFRKSLCL